MNRRDFLSRTASFPLAVGMGLGRRGISASLSDSPPSPSFAKDHPDMLLSDLASKLNALSRHWDRERERIVTPAQVEARNRYVREKFLEMIRGFPTRLPLNPRTAKGFEREGYRVENVMFQSRPDFWVTGNLYIPSAGKGPYPGIISPTGHDPLARMDRVYQCAYINLVKNGFVVLAYDPIGQGERRYYWNPTTGIAEVSADPIFEHSMPGQLMLLMGDNLTQFRIWDGIRAIDYLLTRPEVDGQRIGCAGHSGGGTLTLFITVLDERIKCAVLNEGGGSQRWPIHLSPGSRFGPSDVEQNLFPSAIHGVDLEDLRVAIAPRPQLVTIEEYSPGFRESRQRVLARYQQLGAPERFETAEANDPHSWTMKLRLATTDWFCRWFYGRRGPVEELEFEVEPAPQLYCTPNGSLRYSREGETIFSLIQRKASQLPPKRKLPSNPSEWEASCQECLSQLGRLTRMKKVNSLPSVRPQVTTDRKGYRIEKLEFLSEPGIYIPAWVFVPNKRSPNATAILYVGDVGIEAEGLEYGVLAALARSGNLVVAVDVRGIGETEPPHDPEIRAGGEFSHLFNVETAMSYMAWFMDESLLGMRVRDVVRSVDYALGRPDVDPEGIWLVGKGMGALWVLLAAAQDPRIKRAICDGGLLCYRTLAFADRYTQGANLFIRDVLLHFDLPQVAACVASRDLVLLSPVDAMGNPVQMALARDAYQWTGEAYAAKGAGNRFRIAERSADLDVAEQYLRLLQGED